MKKLLFIFAIGIMCGCEDDTTDRKIVSGGGASVKELELKGHSYLIYDGYHAGNIIHAEHCKCKQLNKCTTKN